MGPAPGLVDCSRRPPGYSNGSVGSSVTRGAGAAQTVQVWTASQMGGARAPPTRRSRARSGRTPNVGVRVVIMVRLLAFRPDLPDSKARDAVALPNAALLAMHARVSAALGGTPPVESESAQGAGAAAGK